MLLLTSHNRTRGCHSQAAVAVDQFQHLPLVVRDRTSEGVDVRERMAIEGHSVLGIVYLQDLARTTGTDTPVASKVSWTDIIGE
jgi:hypothetical protein